MHNILLSCPDTSWAASGSGAATAGVEEAVETGEVLCFPQLPFRTG